MKICVFGASITWGAFDEEAGGWVERLKVHFFNTDQKARVYNCGVSGDRVEHVLKRFPVEASSRKPDKIIISVGVNDGKNVENPEGTPVAQFQDSYNKLLNKAEEFTKDVLVVGLTNLGRDKVAFGHMNEEIRQHNELIKEICLARKTPFIDCFGILSAEDFYADDLHPNAEGHKKIFEKVLAAIGQE